MWRSTRKGKARALNYEPNCAAIDTAMLGLLEGGRLSQSFGLTPFPGY
jgi:hypothetical protein